MTRLVDHSDEYVLESDEVAVARHVLWFYRNSEGEHPGGFVEALLTAISRADLTNKARLELAFPVYVETMRRGSADIPWLRSLAKGAKK